jgi:hypothetical protein
MRGILAREKLRLQFYTVFPPQISSSIATAIRDGFGAHLAVRFGLAESVPETYARWNPKRTGESLSAAAIRVRQAIERHDRTASVPFEMGAVVGAAFAEQVTASYSLAELPQMSQQKMAGLFWEFLGTF